MHWRDRRHFAVDFALGLQMQNLEITLLLVGIVVRVVLDLWSGFRPAAWLDLSYATLFIILGMVFLGSEGLSVSVLCFFGIAALSFVSFVRRRRSPNPALQPTDAPSARRG